MADVLLVYPNTMDIPVSPEYDLYERLMFEFGKAKGLVGLAQGSLMPPAAMLSIAALLKENSIPTAFLDLTVECYGGGDMEHILRERLKKEDPKIVGINGMEACLLSEAYRIARIVKEYNRDIVTVTGGVEATAIFYEVLKNSDIDFVVMGEGELTFLDLSKMILSNQRSEFKQIKGISFQEKGHIFRTEKREFMELEELPLPDREIYPLEKAYSINGGIDILYASRGCPHDCAFCNAPPYWGRRWRKRDPEKVVDELRFIESSGGRIVHIYDLNFGTNKKWVTKIVEGIKREKLDIAWDCELRISDFSKSYLKTLGDGNCKGVFCGIESAEQSVLDSVQKGYTADVLMRSLKNAKEAGINVDAGLIFGLPEDTVDSMRALTNLTWKLLNEELVQTPAPFLFVPFRGTEIGDNPEKFGIKIVNNNYDEWHFFPPNPITSTKRADANLIYDEHIRCLNGINQILESKLNDIKEAMPATL